MNILQQVDSHRPITKNLSWHCVLGVPKKQVDNWRTKKKLAKSNIYCNSKCRSCPKKPKEIQQRTDIGYVEICAVGVNLVKIT